MGNEKHIKYIKDANFMKSEGEICKSRGKKISRNRGEIYFNSKNRGKFQICGQ